MSDSQLDNSDLRAVLREISDRVGGPVRPRYIASMDSVDIEMFVSQFGSLAHACLEAGRDYRVEELDSDVYAAGQWDVQRRQRLIEDIVRIVDNLGHAPTERNLKAYGRGHSDDTIQAFGSWTAAVLEAGLDPENIPGYVSPAAFREELQALADQVGTPPSRNFAAEQGQLDLGAYDTRFSTWDVAVESAGLNPDHIDKRREFVWELEVLAGELGHRPNPDEIEQYTVHDTHLIQRKFEPLENLLDAGNIPNQRDLTPSGSLTRPPDGTAQIPSHTDILREVFALRRRSGGPLETAEAQQQALDDRGIINETHYKTQFGSVSEAFDYAAGLDAKSYSEPRDERVREVPKELLAEQSQELAEILDRRPLVDEVLALTETTLEAYTEEFDSWETVFKHKPFGDSREPIGTDVPTNADLLEAIEHVGGSIGQPPTAAEFREMGYYPVESVLRRFGSWPAALAAVGVEITPEIPSEYLAGELTRETIHRANRLYKHRFDHQALLRDDLYRIAVDLGRSPTSEDVDTFGSYPLETYENTFEDVSSVVDANLDSHRDGLREDDQRSQLIADLKAVGELLGSKVWPREVAFFGRYTLPSYLAVFDSLEVAFAAASLETDHLPRPVDSWAAAWDQIYPEARVFLDALRTQYEETGEAPTMAHMNETGTSAQQCYEYYDTWEEALIVAGIPTERRSPNSGVSPAELREALQDMADELGRIPKTVDVVEHCKYGLNTYYNYYATWQEAVTDAGVTVESDSDGSDTESTSTIGESDLVAQISADIEESIDEDF